jgi:hypothetical protein
MTFALTETIEDLLGELKGAGSINAMAHCPLHQDRHPSLSINQEEGLWKCHSCGNAGDLEKLARIVGEKLPDEFYWDRAIMRATQIPPTEHNFAPLANSLYDRGINEERGDTAIRNYMANRGISIDARHHFWMGWDGSRISFPYWDNDSRRRPDAKCTAIKYRDNQGNKSSETGSKRTIYNIEESRGASKVLVCEGESDTHAAWSFLRGTDWRVCGIPGASVSDQQWQQWAIEFLWSERVVLAFDADEAGDKGAALAIATLGEKAERLRPDDTTSGRDIVDHLRKHGRLNL